MSGSGNPTKHSQEDDAMWSLISPLTEQELLGLASSQSHAHQSTANSATLRNCIWRGTSPLTDEELIEASIACETTMSARDGNSRILTNAFQVICY